MSVNDSKPWWQSSTIWAGLGSLVVAIAGFVLDQPASSSDIVQGGVEAQQVLTGVLGLLAIIGRLRATKRIG
ncbi:hypothetical protein [Novosphingobium huizhouense]|uniref:hypothetical protein n=1 Tax=Novosphingobium huizhouense TaxID=2866625 RepID=UPI001CD87213|nr:hypothetical protein [Novosphingobium huizhouense]